MLLPLPQKGCSSKPQITLRVWKMTQLSLWVPRMRIWPSTWTEQLWTWSPHCLLPCEHHCTTLWWICSCRPGGWYQWYTMTLAILAIDLLIMLVRFPLFLHCLRLEDSTICSWGLATESAATQYYCSMPLHFFSISLHSLLCLGYKTRLGITGKHFGTVWPDWPGCWLCKSHKVWVPTQTSTLNAEE